MYRYREVSLYSRDEVYCVIPRYCRIEHPWTFPRVFAPTSSNISHLAPLSRDGFWCQFLCLQKGQGHQIVIVRLTIIRRIIVVQENTNVPPTQRQEIIEHISIKTVLLTSIRIVSFPLALSKTQETKEILHTSSRLKISSSVRVAGICLALHHNFAVSSKVVFSSLEQPGTGKRIRCSQKYI